MSTLCTQYAVFYRYSFPCSFDTQCQSSVPRSSSERARFSGERVKTWSHSRTCRGYQVHAAYRSSCILLSYKYVRFDSDRVPVFDGRMASLGPFSELRKRTAGGRVADSRVLVEGDGVEGECALPAVSAITALMRCFIGHG